MPETLTLERPSTGRIFLKQRLVCGVMVILLGLAAHVAPALTRMGWLRVKMIPTRQLVLALLGSAGQIAQVRLQSGTALLGHPWSMTMSRTALVILCRHKGGF
jgi:hypothetical protein